MIEPVISIIIPLYNKETAIASTVNSVLSQECEVPFEIIVVDDGSTDNSAKIVKEITSVDTRVRYIHKCNEGASIARNTGISLAKGQWIGCLDADDLMDKNALRILYSMTQKYKDIVFVHANYYIIDGENKYLALPRMKDCIIRNGFKMLFYRQGLPCQGTYLMHRNLIAKYPFDNTYSRYEDMKRLLDIFRDGIPVATTKTPVMSYRRNYSSLSKPNNPSRDFIAHLDFSNKSFWEKILLAQLHNEAQRCYGDKLSAPYEIIAKRWLIINHILTCFMKIIDRRF